MGVKSRRKKAKRENPPFRITVGVTMSEADGADIAQQVAHQSRTLKAALLYADQVTICGPMLRMMLALAKVPEFSEEQKIALLGLVAPTITGQTNIVDEYRNAKKITTAVAHLLAPTFEARVARSRLPKEELADLEVFANQFQQMKAEVEKSFTELSKTARETSKELGIDELHQLIVGGGVEVVQLGPAIDDVEIVAGAVQSAAHLKQVLETGVKVGEKLKLNQEEYKEEIQSDLMTQLKRMASSPTDYPLFDKFTANLLHLALKENKFQISAIQQERARHVGLSAVLLERLPLFDQATASELFDIRNGLQDPLIRFRQAMIKFSSEMKLASWEPEFQLEVERVFRGEIEPVVLALEEEMRSNKYLLEIGRRIPERPLMVSGTTSLGIAMANAKVLNEAWYTFTAVSVGAGLLALDAWNQYTAKRKEIESNQLFFYVKAKRELSA